jgi:intracellular sulfur oxidation DsrE/DsrF family protein
MSKFGHLAKIAMIGATALLLAASSSVAQTGGQSWTPSTDHSSATMTPPAVTHRERISIKRLDTARKRNRKVLARMDRPSEHKRKLHRLILQVNTNDPAAMNLALNNATNVTQYYKDSGEKVKIEVIAFGPGLHMLREDTSPVKARIETMALSSPEVSFKACGNTQENMRKAENKDIPIIPQAQVVESGVVRVMELEEQGWTYVKP